MSIRNLFAALLLAPGPLLAQDPFADSPEAGDEVKASLVAEQTAIVPGQKLTVALKLEHKEHWHSFWQNGGAFSQPTVIKWKLPDGITAGPTIWPVPAVHPAEGFDDQVQHFFEGTVYLLTDLEAPAALQAGTKVKLEAHVDMQVCTTGQCKQPKFDLSLELPVAAKAEPVPAVAAAADAVRKVQPVASPAWKTTFTLDGENWKVRAEPGEGAAADPGKLYFFDRVIATEPMVQDWKKDGAAWVLTITAQETKPPGQKPAGFLHAEKSLVAGAEVFNIVAGDSATPPPPAPAQPAAPSAAAPGNADEDALVAEILSWGTRPLGGAVGDEGKLSGALAIFFAFIGGIILNLMPCVFPVLGIKILSFVKQSGEDHAAVKAHGLVYAAGVIFSLMMLAGLLVSLRLLGKSVGWGFQLQNPWFLVALITIVFGFSLSMVGVFEFGTRLTSVGSELQEQSGYRGSFFSGLLTVLLATPCTGPFMGPALGFALNDTTPLWLVVVIFLALSVGLALPYVILSWFPALVKKLPRPGAWMETFKQFMAFPMFATAIWLVSVFGGSTGEGGIIYLFFALTVFALAIWLYGRFFQRPAKPRSKSIATVAAVLSLGGAGWLAAEAVHQVPSTTSGGHGETPLSAQTIVERRKKGQTTVVDFWATWCLQCELNRKAGFDTSEFREALPGYNAIFMLGDKTKSGSASDLLSDKFLNAYKQGGIPYALVIPPKGPVIVLPSIITSPAVLIDGLKEAQRQAQ